MKLISLNTWGGRVFAPLINFIKQQTDTDIFCFQEMHDTFSDTKQYKDIRANLLAEIKQLLPNFQVFYLPVVKGYDSEADLTPFDLTFGSAIFIHSSIKIISHHGYIISEADNSSHLKKDFSNLPTPLQKITFQLNSKEFTVFNFHGTPMPGNKLDTDKRLKETNKAKEIINNQQGAKILAGDFNLLPQTHSIKIFEADMRNLITEFQIKTTRSSLSPYFGTPVFQEFADYTFVSPEVKVTSFNVPNVNISDHLPMILEFS